MSDLKILFTDKLVQLTLIENLKILKESCIFLKDLEIYILPNLVVVVFGSVHRHKYLCVV